VFIWIFSNLGGKKKTPPKRGQSQPWDQAKRRQSPPPSTSTFPKLEDLGKELQDLILEMSGNKPAERTVPKEQPPEPTMAEQEDHQKVKESYRVKPMREGETFSIKSLKPSTSAKLTPTTFSSDKIDKVQKPQTNLPLISHSLIQGIIMSEILQPPRAKRSYRRI
jgi:hypothetical protein